MTTRITRGALQATNEQKRAISPALDRILSPPPAKRAKTAKASPTTAETSECTVKPKKKAVAKVEDKVKVSRAKVKTEPVVLPRLAREQMQNVVEHPELTFDYEEARRHLIFVDERFRTLMDALHCTPFEGGNQDPFDPFRSLVVSIIGQQISYKAARSITNTFTRVFFPDLPPLSKPGVDTPPSEIGAPVPVQGAPFPSPHDVLELAGGDEEARTALLRAAGLSGRKVEYIVGIAEQFANGTLTAQNMLSSTDAEVAASLIKIRGIGQWTIDMFEIFSLRRPNVMPVGDLGIQKAMINFLASPTVAPQIDPVKLEIQRHARATTPDSLLVKKEMVTPIASTSTLKTDPYPTPTSPLPYYEIDHPDEKLYARQREIGNTFIFPETSNILTPAILKARLKQKLKGNIYLSPTEMIELSDPWGPYRSVACWYLWSILDGSGDP